MRRAKSGAGSVPLGLTAVAAVSVGSLMWYLVQVQPDEIARLVPIARLILWTAALAVALALGVLWMARHEPASLDRWLVAFAACCLIAIVILWIVKLRLETFVASA